MGYESLFRNPLPRDFGLEVVRGRWPGISSVNKFGETTDADSGILTDIWSGADGVTSTDIWVPPTQARVHALVSTSDLDSDSGGVNPQSTGMRTCRVLGLQDWDSAESSEDVTLDGTTAVNTANSYVIIHRIIGLTFGSGETNAGIITATAATDNTVTAVIPVGEGQTFMVIYGVPSIQTLHITHLETSMSGVGTAIATGRLIVRENADQADFGDIHKDHFRFTELSPLHREYTIPKSFTGPLIAKIQVTTNTNNSIVSGGFDAYVVTK